MTEEHRKPLTIHQLKEATGYSISTLRRRIKDGSIPFIQPGGPGTKMMFPTTLVDELCKRRTTQSKLVDDNDDAKTETTGEIQLTPDYIAARQHLETDAISSQDRGIHRSEAGPIPRWMQSPLFHKSNSNTHKPE